MKMIKIAKENAKSIEKALGEVNGRATAHTFTTFSEIEKVAMNFEKSLSILLKKDRNGAKFVAYSGESVSNSYDYGRKATKVTIEKRSTGFFLIDVSSETIHQNGRKSELLLTPAQDLAAISLFKTKTGYKIAS